MKLIQKGNWLEPWSGKVTCMVCLARLEIDESDLKPEENRTNLNYFHCLDCGKKNYLSDENKLPLRVIEDLNKRRKIYHTGGWRD